MTPNQMLRSKGVPVTSLAHPTTRQAPRSETHETKNQGAVRGLLGDHVIKVLEPPAQGKGVRVRRSEIEPWELEQLLKSNCPTCMDNVLHMVCTQDPTIHYYTCEGSPVDHRWTILDG